MIKIRKNNQWIPVAGKSDKEILVVVSSNGQSGIITGKNVPVLTAEQITEIYNAVIGGKAVFIASVDNEYFIVKQVNSDDDNIYVYFDFEETNILKYTLDENEDVTITTKEIGSGEAIETLVPITWAELKTLRDNEELIPGQKYRITDYQCTTTQFDTKSAAHQFDIIVVADDEKTLNENATAIKHEFETKIFETRIYYIRGEETSYQGDYLTFLDDYEFDGQLCGRWVRHEPGAYAEDEPRYVILNARIVDGQLDKELAEIEQVAIVLVDDETVEYPNDSEEQPWGTHSYTFNRIAIVDILDYFKDAHLEAWQLKYCLDNDTLRFGWALDANIKAIKVYEDEDVIYIHVRCPEKDEDGKFAWAYVESNDSTDFEDVVDWSDYDSSDIGFTNTEDIIPGETIFEYNGYSAPVIDLFSRTGKGVIYYMKDEWNNECPYDFKNIQFKRYKVYDITENGILSNLDGKYLGYLGNMQGLEIDEDEEDFIWCYTFYYVNIYNNTIEDISLNPFKWKELDSYTIKAGVTDNVIKETFTTHSVDEGDLLSVQYLNNIVINEQFNASYRCCSGNVFEAECIQMSFLSSCLGNHILYDNRQLIAGLNFKSNTINAACFCNTFGNGCQFNTFGNSCSNNIFSNNNITNIFGNSSSYNTFGNGCQFNTFGNSCSNNIFSNNNITNIFGNSSSYNTFGNGCDSNILGNNCNNNKFGDNCTGNNLGNHCYRNKFGDACRYNTLFDNVSDITTDYYATHNIFENGVSNLDLRAAASGSSSGPLCNITVRQGIQGTWDSHIVINESRGLTHDVTYRKANAEDKTI